jgi:hypothetical protein
MLRFIVAFLFLTVVGAPAARAQPAPAANTAAQIAEEKARADKAEHDLAIREAADQIENAQTEQAYNRFEIWTGVMMGGFSVLVTLLVIVFGFRTEKAAGVAARQEVANAKGQIDELLSEAKKATAAAVAAQSQAEATKVEVDELLKQSKAATTTAKANAEEAARHVEATRQSAAIIDGLKSGARDSNRDAPKLTPAQEEIVKEAASGTQDTPEAEWSVEEYKTRIGKARYLDKDWNETLRLAGLMAQNHGADDEAYAFARNAEGDALREFGRDRDAILAYDATTSRLGVTPKVELELLLMWAVFHKGMCLTNAGNPAKAEAQFRMLLPLCENINGIEDGNTLATRHELARAMLDQGRAEDAEAELQALLPLRERIEGLEAVGTIVTRHVLARAILDQGRSGEAEAGFRALLPLFERIDGVDHPGTMAARFLFAKAVLENGDAAGAKALLAGVAHQPVHTGWRERSSAELAFIRGKVADALGERAEADEWFEKAAAHYTAAYPVDHYYRRKFDAYLAARPGA